MSYVKYHLAWSAFLQRYLDFQSLCFQDGKWKWADLNRQIFIKAFTSWNNERSVEGIDVGLWHWLKGKLPPCCLRCCTFFTVALCSLGPKWAAKALTFKQNMQVWDSEEQWLSDSAFTSGCWSNAMATSAGEQCVGAGAAPASKFTGCELLSRVDPPCL